MILACYSHVFFKIRYFFTLHTALTHIHALVCVSAVEYCVGSGCSATVNAFERVLTVIERDHYSTRSNAFSKKEFLSIRNAFDENAFVLRRNVFLFTRNVFERVLFFSERVLSH